MRRPTRALCVDDDFDAADTTATLLALLGCDARACYDGPSALAAAAEFAPDICFIDLTMPGMDGDELAVRLREEAGGRPLRLVCVSGHGGEADFRRTAAAGFDLHLVKPVVTVDLLAALRDSPADPG